MKTSDNSEAVNQINTTLFRNDLNFSFVYHDESPTWQIEGDFDVLQTGGSLKGTWRNHKQFTVVIFAGIDTY